MIPKARVGVLGVALLAASAAAQAGAYEITAPANPGLDDVLGRTNPETYAHERTSWENRQRHRRGNSKLDRAKRARGRL